MKFNLNITQTILPIVLPTLFLLIFANYIFTDAVLMTTDAAISVANESAITVLNNITPHWNNDVLLGGPAPSATGIPSLLKAVLPGISWNNLVYGLAILISSFVFLFGFRSQLNAWAVLCGGLAAFWFGNNFTMIYPGHAFKPYVVLFFICSLLSAGIASWRGGILWGSFVGLMFAQQPDIALFFALFAGIYLIFRLWLRDGFKFLRWIPVLVPAAAVALLFAAEPLLSGYKMNIQDTAQVQTENPAEKWDYITQWSWPPEESIAFIAPGYTGWRSGEPEGPYYGRMGRSAGWEQTRQGFMNFQLDSLYLGFIPIAFALFALFSARKSSHRNEILFWSVAACAAILLSFGKYFPLYSLFYQLPVVNNVRAPVKFIQIFQVAIGILAAFGIHQLMFAKPVLPSPKSKNPPPLDPAPRWFFWTIVGTTGILLLWALGLSVNQADVTLTFTKIGWPEGAAQIIVANQIRSLWHACFMAGLTSAAFAVFSFNRFTDLRTKGNWIAAGLAIVMATDAIILSKHYVQTMPRSYIQENDLTRFLHDNQGTQRVALLSQQGIYNIWVTYLFPFNHINTFNFSQMARMPVEYKNFLEAGAKDPLRMWRFASVKYLLGPTSFEKQLPAGQVRKVFTYDIGPTQNNEFHLIPTPRGAHAVYELLDSVPRYVLVAGFKPDSDDLTLARIRDRQKPLLSGQGITGSIEVVQYRPGKVVLRTSADTSTMLRVAERWDPNWKAQIDGNNVAVQRIDYLCQGVELPPGPHAVTLTYSPDKWFFYMQVVGLVILLATGISMILQRKRPTRQ